MLQVSRIYTVEILPPTANSTVKAFKFGGKHGDRVITREISCHRYRVSL